MKTGLFAFLVDKKHADKSKKKRLKKFPSTHLDKIPINLIRAGINVSSATNYLIIAFCAHINPGRICTLTFRTLIECCFQFA